MSHADHTWHVPGCWDCEDQADDESKAELWAQVAAHVTHHPALYSTARHGCWATCACRWESRRWTTTTGAHLEFGRHLIDPRENCNDHRPQETTP